MQRFELRLDPKSGVPVYRQIFDEVVRGISTGLLSPGHQLPTVRQLAVDLTINPNTVIRAYRELEVRGFVDTQQGSGTYISTKKIEPDEAERQRRLDRLAGEVLARAGSEGFSADELIERLRSWRSNG